MPSNAHSQAPGVPMYILKHCAQECLYQRSGEMSVYNMAAAWLAAQVASREGVLPDKQAVLWIGGLVEPLKNQKGFRKVGVRVGWDVKMEWHKVPRAMARLLAAAANVTPAEFFREFEEIHPFVDGNGRTGNILYNWLNGSLDDPLMPPDYWDQGRIVGRVS